MYNLYISGCFDFFCVSVVVSIEGVVFVGVDVDTITVLITLRVVQHVLAVDRLTYDRPSLTAGAVNAVELFMLIT